jgi:peptide/nickel transport system substrate-binding protein
MNAERTRTWMRAPLALIAGLIITSCAPSAAPSASPSANAEQGQYGTLTVATPAVPNTVDPAILIGGAHYVQQSVMGQLVVHGPIPATATKLHGPQDLVGELAESWTRDADGSYTFTLRGMVSPAGNPLTSDDVKWTWQRNQQLGPIFNAIANAVNIDTKDPIKVTDAKHFTLRATSPGPDALAGLVQFYLGVFDSVEAKKHATAEDPWAKTWLATNSASYGPYVVSSFVPNDTVTLTANPNYWQKSKGLPGFKTVIVRQVPDAGTRASLIASGQVDYVTAVAFGRIKSLADTKGVRPATVPSLLGVFITFDGKKPPFDSPDARRAVSVALDRQALTQSGYAGYAKPLYSLFVDALGVTHPANEDKYTKFDLTMAKSLVAKVPGGISFQLTYSSGADPEIIAMAQVVQQQLAAAGIKMDLNPVTPAQASAGLTQFQSTISGNLGPLIPDAGYWAKLEWYGPSSLFAPGYSNPRVTQLIDGLQSGKTQTRDADITEMLGILGNDMPSIPLIQQPMTWVFANGVTGEYGNPAQGINYEYLKRSN